jgi:hypothetical protein
VNYLFLQDNYYFDDAFDVDEMDGACSTHGKHDNTKEGGYQII